MKDKKTSMSKINSRHPQLSDWSMDKSSTPSHHCDSRLEMQEITNESSTNLQNHNTDQHPVQIQTKTTCVKIKKSMYKIMRSFQKVIAKNSGKTLLITNSMWYDTWCTYRWFNFGYCHRTMVNIK